MKDDKTGSRATVKYKSDTKEVMLKFLDALLYAVLSYVWLLSLLAGALWVVRARTIKRAGARKEPCLYFLIIAFGMTVWLWNGLHPTPNIFEDRAGLYWGIKTDKIKWRILSYPYDISDNVMFSGNSCLLVTFEKSKGWLIFHHFPTAPALYRYEAVEFYLRKMDLQHDALLMTLYGDGKVQYPSSEGISVDNERYLCDNASRTADWKCFRVPLADFELPGTGIIGIGIGKSNGVDEGNFYLDKVRLIEK